MVSLNISSNRPPQCHILIYLFIFCYHVQNVCVITAFSARAICDRIPGLTPQQRRVCIARPDAISFIGEGARLGIRECQRQFTHHRWNCTPPGTQSIFGHQFTFGSREAAYAYGISSAGVTYTITRGCSRGNISSCGCDKSFRAKYGYIDEGWKWGGCSADIKYGMRFAKKFLDSKEDAFTSDSRALMNLHNNRAGRKAVKVSMVKTCKCHGVSGSCTMKTCWRTLPAFNIIGDRLMTRYSHAKHVIPSSSTKKYRQLYDGISPPPTVNVAPAMLLLKRHKNLRSQADVRSNAIEPKSRDLVFLDTSPNYCEANSSFDSLGTIGRQCNRSLESFDSCRSMCCGRGYNTQQYYRKWQCECKFVWCCFVQCKVCTALATYYTCK